MMCFRIFAILLAAVATLGCAQRTETTEDSIKVETEVPKVEIGDAPVDLDVRTDEDVDVDTPMPGDN